MDNVTSVDGVYSVHSVNHVINVDAAGEALHIVNIVGTKEH